MLKIRMPRDYKKYFTLEELEQMNQVRTHIKEWGDSPTAEEWLRMAAFDIIRWENDHIVEVLKAEAKFARNCRVWNVYGEATGNMDIWITGVVQCWDQVLEIGCYMTDIWNIDGRNNIVRDNAYVVRYKKQ